MIGSLWFVLGCGVPTPSISVSEDVVTLATASWSYAADERVRVEVDTTDGPWLVTDWQVSAADGSAALLGLLPDSAYRARLVAEGGDASPYVDFLTGSLPTHVPSWTVSGTPGWHGYLLTAIISPDPAPSTVVILDETGQVVWYHQGRQGHRVLRVRVAPDNAGLRFAEIEPAVIPETSALVRVDWSGKETSRLELPGFTHDFVDTPDGDAAAMLLDIRPGRSGADVLGDALVDVADDGSTTPIWSIWDEHTPPPDDEMDQQIWSHANALDWDPQTQSYWLGTRNLSTLFQVFPDGTPGVELGGDNSAWTFANRDTDAPRFQHQFTFTDAGILFFDDRDPASGDDSRLLELTLDNTAMTAEKSWEWHHEPPLSVYALGDVDRSPDGSTLATFSSAGVIDDIGPDGEVRWEMQTELAAGIPYVVRLAELPGVTRVR